MFYTHTYRHTHTRIRAWVYNSSMHSVHQGGPAHRGPCTEGTPVPRHLVDEDGLRGRRGKEGGGGRREEGEGGRRGKEEGGGRREEGEGGRRGKEGGGGRREEGEGGRRGKEGGGGRREGRSEEKYSES